MYRKHAWVALVVVLLLGLAACGQVQPGGELPGASDQAVSPTPAAVTGGNPGAGAVPGPADASTPGREGIPPAETGGPTLAPGDEYPIEADCTGSDPHPIGQSIAETYEVPYEIVMTWFCSGYSFENILIALETGEAVDVPAETLLLMLLDRDWEEIWDEIGFVEERQD